MKNIKKLGLTALAGSLVATSAYSADMAVTGSAELTYTTTSGTTKGGVDGNQWGFEKGIGWSASGEVMGYDVTLATTLDDNAALSSSSLTFDLGDMGKIYFDADLSKFSWFNLGGPAKVLFKPENLQELSSFLKKQGYSVGVAVRGHGRKNEKDSFLMKDQTTASYIETVKILAKNFNGRAALIGIIALLGAYSSTGQIIPGWF